MSEMPTLGRSPRRPRRRFARVAIVVVLVAGGGYAGWRYLRPRRPAEPQRPTLVATPGVVDRDAGPRPPETPPPPPSPADVLKAQGVRFVKATVAGPLETAFVTEVGRELGEPLTQVVTRTLVWWVQIPDDLRRGDTIEVLFSERQGAEPLVQAVRFQSAKSQKTYEAYRFQPAGAPYPRFFTRDGQELELRLKNAPLDDHEQVTSLIRDGRGHKGVDFRVPLGTPVKAPFDAIFVRKNWNFPMNGNCVELREDGGERRTAYFLHLSEVAGDLKPGEHVAKGQVIAKSGNTGHSFAPHLHYQLMTAGGALLDPFAADPTERRALTEAQRPAFDAEVARLDGLFTMGRGH